MREYNNVIIFLILEGIALSLLTSGNNYHNTRVVKGIRVFTAGIERSISKTRSYFRLREIGESLSMENAALKNRIEQMEKKENPLFFSVD